MKLRCSPAFWVEAWKFIPGIVKNWIVLTLKLHLSIQCSRGPGVQDDVCLARHEDGVQARAAGELWLVGLCHVTTWRALIGAGAHLVHLLLQLLLRPLQPHLQGARAPDEALQQPGN